ncbi:HAD-IA family hydrolase [Nonomuraea sp. NPDC051941]|uniref:HAD-IA family hydrolase n=1 Tax=Nonomuraea sp. NPDC051941 TaxID=3364373 RepID=UPI0037CAD20C
MDDTLVGTYETGFAKCREVARVLDLDAPDRTTFSALYGAMSFDECVKRLHPGVDAARYVSAYDALATRFPPVPLCDGILLRDAVEKIGARIGILTNGPGEKTWGKLRACGFDASDFDFVVHADNAAVLKPDIGSFIKLGAFGVDSRAAWYVSDSAAEWRAAETAGFRSVGVGTGRPASSGYLPTLLLPNSSVLPEVVPLLVAATGSPHADQPAAVTFDAGFTLVEHIRDPARVVRDHLARSGPAPATAEVNAALAGAAAVLASPQSWWADPVAADGTLRRFYGEVLNGLGRGSPSGAGAILGEYVSPANWRALPGASEVLATARASGRRIGVLSNWQPSLPEVLTLTGLDQYVDVILPSTTIGVAKPSPEAFLAAADALGVTPRTLLHVGDRLADDVLGALRAGCRAALVAGPVSELAAAFRTAGG